MVNIINIGDFKPNTKLKTAQPTFQSSKASNLNLNNKHDTVTFSGILKKQQPETQTINIQEASKRLNKASQLMQDMARILEEDQKREIPVFKRITKGTLEKIFNLAMQGTDKPLAIGIAGGSASGKSTIKDSFYSKLTESAPEMPNGRPFAQEISHDNFYYDFSDEINKHGAEYVFKNKNLDHPKAVETSLLVKKLRDLKKGIDVRIPEFLINGTGIRKDDAIPVKSSPIIVVEGMFTLADKKLRELLDLKVFVDASKEVRAKRWWDRAPKRNIKHDAGGEALFKRTFTMHDTFVEPSKAHADIVINSEAEINAVNNVLEQIAKAITKPISFTGLFKNKKAA